MLQVIAHNQLELGRIDVWMLHLNLAPEHRELLFLVLEHLVGLRVVSLGLLELLEDLLHG